MPSQPTKAEIPPQGEIEQKEDYSFLCNLTEAQLCEELKKHDQKVEDLDVYFNMVKFVIEETIEESILFNVVVPSLFDVISKLKQSE